MYALLAIPFRSYIQPVIIMSAIPFGIVGAVMGHFIMGYELSIISMMGIIALSGVVVNDSLVLIDAANTYRAEGLSPVDAVVKAGRRRMRPILLTSLTTFFGLLPMIWETSPQAKFLIPMAISLGFGVLFATIIVLLLVPALYILVEDLIKVVAFLTRWLSGGDAPEQPLEGTAK
jgi:multidrug efflux pump subunit AcrB